MLILFTSNECKNVLTVQWFKMIHVNVTINEDLDVFSYSQHCRKNSPTQCVQHNIPKRISVFTIVVILS